MDKYRIANEKLGRLSLPERILLRFSKDPAGEFLAAGEHRPTQRWGRTQEPLRVLRRDFPNFDERILGKTVLDYGCGDGHQAVAMAKAGADRVLGVDINEKALEGARRLAAELDVADRVEFDTRVREGFDIVTSQSAFEHFVDPEQSLRDMRSALSPNGEILVTFGPPWLAPYGAHMFFFTNFPWVNVCFSEQTVMRVRSLYREGGTMTYEPGLNRMTVRRFERLTRENELDLSWKRYRCVAGIDVLGKIPGLREFFVNQVIGVLSVR